MRWPKYWSFSFSIIPSKEIPGLISFRMDCLDLLAVQGTLKSLLQYHSLKASILQRSAFPLGWPWEAQSSPRAVSSPSPRHSCRARGREEDADPAVCVPQRWSRLWHTPVLGTHICPHWPLGPPGSAQCLDTVQKAQGQCLKKIIYFLFWLWNRSLQHTGFSLVEALRLSDCGTRA